MISLRFPESVNVELEKALRGAGRREIGGVLMAEHTGANTFQVIEITIQSGGGKFASFVRLVELISKPLREFFRKTNQDYTRFNYIGEWHSHHSFKLQPSATDNATMHELASDPALGANFVVLLLVRLDEGAVSKALMVYTRDGNSGQGRVLDEC